MSRVCELTGKRAMVGNNVSHAMNNKTKRKFSVNLVKKRFYIPEEDRWVTLKKQPAALKRLIKMELLLYLKMQKLTDLLNLYNPKNIYQNGKER